MEEQCLQLIARLVTLEEETWTESLAVVFRLSVPPQDVITLFCKSISLHKEEGRWELRLTQRQSAKKQLEKESKCILQALLCAMEGLMRNGEGVGDQICADLLLLGTTLVDALLSPFVSTQQQAAEPVKRTKRRQKQLAASTNPAHDIFSLASRIVKNIMTIISSRCNVSHASTLPDAVPWVNYVVKRCCEVVRETIDPSGESRDLQKLSTEDEGQHGDLALALDLLTMVVQAEEGFKSQGNQRIPKLSEEYLERILSILPHITSALSLTTSPSASPLRLSLLRKHTQAALAPALLTCLPVYKQSLPLIWGQIFLLLAQDAYWMEVLDFLCHSFNIYLPRDHEHSLLVFQEGKYWDMIKKGLLSPNDAVTRSKALYLLKRSIGEVESDATRTSFLPQWDQNNWGIFFRIYEALHEHVTHLVRPVWQSISSLWKCVVTTEQHQEHADEPCSSPSSKVLWWLGILFLRALQNPNRGVIKMTTRTFVEDLPYDAWEQEIGTELILGMLPALVFRANKLNTRNKAAKTGNDEGGDNNEGVSEDDGTVGLSRLLVRHLSGYLRRHDGTKQAWTFVVRFIDTIIGGEDVPGIAAMLLHALERSVQLALPPTSVLPDIQEFQQLLLACRGILCKQTFISSPLYPRLAHTGLQIILRNGGVKAHLKTWDLLSSLLRVLLLLPTSLLCPAEPQLWVCCRDGLLPALTPTLLRDAIANTSEPSFASSSWLQYREGSSFPHLLALVLALLLDTNEPPQQDLAIHVLTSQALEIQFMLIIELHKRLGVLPGELIAMVKSSIPDHIAHLDSVVNDTCASSLVPDQMKGQQRDDLMGNESEEEISAVRAEIAARYIHLLVQVMLPDDEVSPEKTELMAKCSTGWLEICGQYIPTDKGDEKVAHLVLYRPMTNVLRILEACCFCVLSCQPPCTPSLLDALSKFASLGLLVLERHTSGNAAVRRSAKAAGESLECRWRFLATTSSCLLHRSKTCDNPPQDDGRRVEESDNHVDTVLIGFYQPLISAVTTGLQSLPHSHLHLPMLCLKSALLYTKAHVRPDYHEHILSVWHALVEAGRGITHKQAKLFVSLCIPRAIKVDLQEGSISYLHQLLESLRPCIHIVFRYGSKRLSFRLMKRLCDILCFNHLMDTFQKEVINMIVFSSFDDEDPTSHPVLDLEKEAHNQPARVLLNAFLAEQITRDESVEEDQNSLCALVVRLLDLALCSRLKEESLGPKDGNRIRCHLWQTICLMIGRAGRLKKAVEEGDVTLPPLFVRHEVQHLIWRSVMDSTRQSGVRHLIQMTALAAMLQCPELVAVLLSELHDFNQRYQQATSLIVIGGQYLAQIEPQHRHFDKLLEALVPWCLHYHHASRVCAQVIVYRIMETHPSVLVEQGMGHTILSHMQRFLKENKDIAKLRETQTSLLEEMSITQCCSLEGLFGNHYSSMDIGKRRSEGASTHPGRTFRERVLQQDLVGEEKLPIELLQSVSTAIRRSMRFSPDLHAGELRGEGSQEGDYQKRLEVTQWLENGNIKAVRRGPAVVVASLLENVPNIAGLLRTSEIMGVGEFAIPELRLVREEAFRRVSMTAERHVNLVGVGRNDISRYLAEKKTQGYTVIGVEQTAGSQPVHSFAFPRKSILVVGHENCGTPHDILSLCDVCVHIPQQGILRSLNAHVAMAIILWEHAKQNLIL